MNKKDFVRNFKIEKSITNDKPFIKKGDLLDMFTCRYKVMDSNLAQVILEDETGSRISLPRNKVDFLIIKGKIAYIGDSMYKSGSSFIDSLLAKAAVKGEGTKGGIIVGHTRSGRPIYQGQLQHISHEGHVYHPVHNHDLYRNAHTGSLHEAPGGKEIKVKELLAKDPEHRVRVEASKNMVLNKISNPDLRAKADKIVDSMFESHIHAGLAEHNATLHKHMPKDVRHEDHDVHHQWAIKAVMHHEDAKKTKISQLQNLIQLDKEK